MLIRVNPNCTFQLKRLKVFKAWQAQAGAVEMGTVEKDNNIGEKSWIILHSPDYYSKECSSSQKERAGERRQMDLDIIYIIWDRAPLPSANNRLSTGSRLIDLWHAHASSATDQIEVPFPFIAPFNIWKTTRNIVTNELWEKYKHRLEHNAG